ncbi:MAG: ABC transporter permease [Chthoniobacterales bacterium]
MFNLRHSLRSLANQPLFSAIVIITCALGIGANTAVFSVVNAVLLRPLPYSNPSRLVALMPYDQRVGTENGYDQSASSYPDFADWRAQNSVFEHVAVYNNESLTLTDGQEAVQLQGQAVSADMFALLGVQPILGRAFSLNEDDPGTHVAILSNDLWKSRFGSDPGVLGRSVTLDGQPFTVVGVMPAGFRFPIRTTPVELWTTMAILRESRDGSKPMTEQRGNNFLNCVARLKNGASLDQAQANMETIATALRKQYPDSNTNLAVKVVPLVTAMVDQARSGLFMLCAMAGCVLLVACLNLANLLLARALSRRKEINIRAALGAGRWHLIKQLVGESLILAAAGGATGLLLSVWGLELLKRFLPTTIPRIDQISLDLRVLSFTAGASLVVGVVSGLLPAWRVSHPGAANSLNEATRGSTEGVRGRRTRAALVVIEIVLALVLLASAGLLVKSFLRLQDVPPGFDPTNIATARIALPSTTYPKSADNARFYKSLLAKISELPGVRSVSAAWWLPLSGSDVSFNFNIEERPLPVAEQPIAQVNSVALDYFKTMSIPVLQGRDFTAQDDGNAPKVVVVSQEFVRQFFPGENPIGKRITPSGSVDDAKPPVREIIGIVGDTHLISLSAKPKPQIYVPHQQFAVGGMSLLVRSPLEPQSLIASLRNVVGSVDKDVPLFRAKTLVEYASQSVSQPRFNAMLVGLFALIALLLAGAGIFGLTSYTVTQRTQEIGIRMALGAQRTDVLRLIIGQGMRLLVIGIVCGFIGVYAIGHLLQSLLFGIGAHDVVTIVSVSAVLSVVALLACWIPAMRAAKVDPVIALRSE